MTNPKYLAVWLSGYDHGRRGDVVIDMQQVVANTDKLEAYCLKNPDVPMMQAAETILSRKTSRPLAKAERARRSGGTAFSRGHLAPRGLWFHLLERHLWNMLGHDELGLGCSRRHLSP